MREDEMILSNDENIIAQSDLYEPMLYYGATARVSIEYISDIHLLHHARFFDGNIQAAVRVMARSLYNSHNERRSPSWSTPIFLGDVSSNKDVVVSFYKQYRLNAIYKQFKQFRRMQVNAGDVLAFKARQKDTKRRISNLEKRIASKDIEFKQAKREVDKYVNYNRVIAPKGNLESVKSYLASNYYKKRELPDSAKEKILAAATLKNEMEELDKRKSHLKFWLSMESAPVETSLRDFQYHPGPLGLVVLGNHEYIDFSNVEEAVEFYRAALTPLGFNVLQNSYVEDSNAVIYGGTGFAKYNRSFNADNVPCCKAMEGNRPYEIEQTTLFEEGYETARKHAMGAGKCFICASHYPPEDCLRKFDRETVYFAGHTHRNKLIRTEEKVLYADNQVGYHKRGSYEGALRFKRATSDSVTNPYGLLEDGYYHTSPDVYLQFCEYIGECVGEGKLIRKRCETGELYVIKSQGYYGFFVVNKSGTSIVNGGKTKKIALNKNIGWIYDNFNSVVRKYIAALEPLRAVQEQISRELKQLGFRGSIHGLIVDIDYFNHIMVNPVDGSITFYYSSWFGCVQQFESFQKQLEFMNEMESFQGRSADMKSLDGGNVAHECDALALRAPGMLDSVENNVVSDEMMVVSRVDGAYGVSRAVNPLQRLFTGHVLRDFDLRLIGAEDENTTVNRTRSVCGRVYCDRSRNRELYLVVRDDLGEFVTLLDGDGNESEASILKLNNAARIRIKGQWLTKNLDETLANYRGKALPPPWREAIQQMQPKKLETRK